MVINALNSGANVFMADFEDSNSPTWQNNIEGQINLRDAVRGTIGFTSPEGKQLRAECQDRDAAGAPARLASDREAFPGGRQADLRVAVRFRPVLLPQRQERRWRKGTGPYFYLPKMESHLEARLWNDVFVFAQDDVRRAARDDPRDGADRDDSRRRSRWTRFCTSCATIRPG